MMRTGPSVQKFVSALTGAHRGALLSLLVTAGAIFALMTFTACDCNDNGIDDCDEAAEKAYEAIMKSLNSQVAKEAAPDATAKIYASHDAVSAGEGAGATDLAAPGGRVWRWLGVDVTSGAPPSQVTYTWRPPEGASDYTFTERQPEPGWDPAQPVFVFRDVPPNEHIPVQLTLPAANPYGGDRLAESLIAQPNAGLATTAYYLTTLAAGVAAQLDDAGAAALWSPPAAAETSPAGPAAPVDMWTVQRWYSRDITVSSSECQQAVDLLQSDAAFVALQLPERPHLDHTSTLLPIYRSPKIELMNPTDGTLYVTGEAAFRPARFTFAANELPAAAEKVWATLGVATTPTLTCPAGLATSNWELHLDFQLDLSYVADNCRGCTLDVFLCYEGQELPGSRLTKYVTRQQANRTLEKLVRTTDAQAGVRDYRDWGITCAGPLPLQMIDDPGWSNWYLVGASAQAITPTWPITLSHTIEGGVPSPPQLIDLAFSSNLAAGWRWSDGAQFITPPISYDGAIPQTIYLVGQAPADAPAGMYSTQITASLRSQPADRRLATDLIWVGDWVAPPLGVTPTATASPAPTSTPTATVSSTPTATTTPTRTQTPSPGPTWTATPTGVPRRYLPLVLR